MRYLNMKKAELIDAVATKSELTKQDSKKAVDALFESISNTLAKEEKIQLIGFGTFEVRERAERTGRNPQTGEEMTIPASKVPAFKPGKELKEAVK
jgi:DNA-binding protein HU-beta